MAVWLLNVALPTVATIAGLTVGGAVLMWVVRAAKNVLQGF